MGVDQSLPSPVLAWADLDGEAGLGDGEHRRSECDHIQL